MQVAVIGAGYVGLVTAACLARLGQQVRVVDVDAPRIAGLRAGHLPIGEPGLEELVAEGVAAGRLSFHDDAAATRGTRLAIVCVGTLDERGEWNGDVVREATVGLARDPDGPRRLVIRSTLMPGTALTIAAAVAAVDPSVAIALNPEFTREGSAIGDFFAPDRVVIGIADAEGQSDFVDDLRSLYVQLSAPVIVTDLTSAEAIKVGSNVFLAAKITFANEMARLCAAAGGDVRSVLDGIGLDRRIGRDYLSPGPGFGGSCFPSQARALPAFADRHGASTPLFAAIAPSNERQAVWLVDRLSSALSGELGGRRVAVLGLGFKVGVDDTRESPGLRIAADLVARGAEVVLSDPIVDATAMAESVTGAKGSDRAATGRAEGASSIEDACRDADAVIVATADARYRALDWGFLAATMRGRIVLDATGIVDPATVRHAGLGLIVLGAPVATSAEVVAVR